MPVVVVEILGAIENDEREIRDRVGLLRAGHAFGFDHIGRRVKACRIDERCAQAVEVDAFGHQVAGGARNVGHDGTRSAGERVEDARLAHVRLADDRDLQSFAHEPSPASIGQQPRRPAPQIVDRACQRALIDEVITLVRKIDRRLEARDEIEQRRIDPGDRLRQRPLQLIERRAGLKRRDGVDQIGDRLGLRQIDPAVEERPQRELPRLGETRSARHSRGDDRPKDDRASVGAELDDVLAGVRMRGRKVGGDDVIDGFGRTEVCATTWSVVSAGL